MLLPFLSAGHVPITHSVRAEDAENPENPFRLYHYRPTEAGAVIFALLFLSTTLWHSWQVTRYRIWIMTPTIVGGLCMCFSAAAAPELASIRRTKLKELIMMLSKYSSSHWLRRPFCFRKRNPRLDFRAIHYSINLASCCACPLRCNDLHGARENHKPY